MHGFNSEQQSSLYLVISSRPFLLIFLPWQNADVNNGCDMSEDLDNRNSLVLYR
jgi:hypothetical protein